MEDNIIAKVKEARARVKQEISCGIKYEAKKIKPLAIGKKLNILSLSPARKLLNKIAGNLWLRSLLAKNPALHDFVRIAYRKITFRKGP